MQFFLDVFYIFLFLPVLLSAAWSSLLEYSVPKGSFVIECLRNLFAKTAGGGGGRARISQYLSPARLPKGTRDNKLLFRSEFAMVARSAAAEHITNPSKKAPQQPNTKYGCCLQCKTTNSRKWRTGPDGIRTLCQACFDLYRCGKLTLYQSECGVSIIQTPGSLPVFVIAFRPVSPRLRHLHPVVGPIPVPQDQLYKCTYKGVPPSAFRSQRPGLNHGDQNDNQSKMVDGCVVPSGQNSFPALSGAPEAGFGSDERVWDDCTIQRRAQKSSTARVEPHFAREGNSSPSDGCELPATSLMRYECANEIINAQPHGTNVHASGVVSRNSRSSPQTGLIPVVSPVLSSTPEYLTGTIPGPERREGLDVEVDDNVIQPSISPSPPEHGLGQGMNPSLRKCIRECGDGKLSGGAEVKREIFVSKAPQAQVASVPPPVSLVPGTTQTMHDSVVPSSYRALSDVVMIESDVEEVVNEATQAPAIAREETGIANSSAPQMQKITKASRSRSEDSPGRATHSLKMADGTRTGRIEKVRSRDHISQVHVKATSKKGETRRFTISPGLQFVQFKEQLKRFFDVGAAVTISYKDEEGDLVTVASNNEMEELFRVALEFAISPVRIYVAS